VVVVPWLCHSARLRSLSNRPINQEISSSKASRVLGCGSSPNFLASHRHSWKRGHRQTVIDRPSPRPLRVSPECRSRRSDQMTRPRPSDRSRRVDLRRLPIRLESETGTGPVFDNLGCFVRFVGCPGSENRVGTQRDWNRLGDTARLDRMVHSLLLALQKNSWANMAAVWRQDLRSGSTEGVSPLAEPICIRLFMHSEHRCLVGNLTHTFQKASNTRKHCGDRLTHLD